MTLQNFITDIPCLDGSVEALLTLADNAFPRTDPGPKRHGVPAKVA
jgi:hypothetical protein